MTPTWLYIIFTLPAGSLRSGSALAHRHCDASWNARQIPHLHAVNSHYSCDLHYTLQRHASFGSLLMIFFIFFTQKSLPLHLHNWSPNKCLYEMSSGLWLSPLITWKQSKMKGDVSLQYSAMCWFGNVLGASGWWESFVVWLDVDKALCMRRLSPPSQYCSYCFRAFKSIGNFYNLRSKLLQQSKFTEALRTPKCFTVQRILLIKKSSEIIAKTNWIIYSYILMY